MKRRLFHLATAASLALCVALGGLWVRSMFVGDYVERWQQWNEGTGNNCHLMHASSTRQGRVALIHTDRRTHFKFDEESGGFNGITYIDHVQWRHSTHGVTDPDLIRTFLGFGFHSVSSGPPNNQTIHRQHIVAIPLWFLMLLTALMPTWSLRRWWQRRSYRPGQCQHCGYDLRATPDRCPECGTPVSQPPADKPAVT